MSDAVFPVLPGATIKITRTPVWAGKTAYSVSQRAQSASFAAYPLWKLTLEYEFLRAGAEQELQQLVGFFNQRRGSWDTFLFDDPDDGAVTAQPIGIGDGTTTSFPLLRSFGGFAEPLSDVTQISVFDGAELQYKAPLPVANLIPNAAFNANVDNVTAGWNQNSLVGVWSGRDIVSSSWRPPGMHAWGANYPGTGTGWVYFQVAQIPVTPGTKYMLSGYLAGYRAQHFLSCEWHDGSGNFISDINTGNCPVDSSKPGGTNLSDWYFGFVAGVAPAGAVSAYITIPHLIQQPDPFWQVLHPMFEVVSPSVASPSEWCPDVPDYSVTNGAATFAIAPDTGDVVSISGTYRRRCRFVASELETERFLYQLYKCGKVELITDKG